MPAQTADFNTRVQSSSNNFLRMKNTNDQVQFRIAQLPVYLGKHFLQLTDEQTGMVKWEVPECPRIASGDECQYCISFFKIKSKQKKLLAGRKKEALEGQEKKDFDNLDKEARGFAPTIEHYFSILDRGDGKAKVLQTTDGVKNKFIAEAEAGTDIMDTEWILRNTGGVGVNKYLLKAVDSKNVKPFTPEEEEEWAKAGGYDLSSIGQTGEDEGDNY